MTVHAIAARDQVVVLIFAAAPTALAWPNP